MEKINIIDILRGCPEGTKLYSLVHGEVELTRVGVEDIYCKPSYLNHELSFNSDGRWVENQGECILFPSKENRDWTKFQRPFKDGDVVFFDDSIAIFKEWGDETLFRAYCTFYTTVSNPAYQFEISRPVFGKGIRRKARFATLEEKEKLFEIIRDNGYEWDPQTKTLKKLPKFKVGDRIKLKGGDKFGIITQVSDWFYTINCKNHTHYWAIAKQDDWELAPSKFDITTLKPFDRVLVRTANFAPVWTIAFYDGYNPNIGGCFRPFGVSSGQYFQQCIPYEGNEHLRGTTNECSEYYKNWE